MSEDIKVYTPLVIEDAPFPGEDLNVSQSSQGGSGDIHKPTEAKELSFPEKKIAVELIGNALNTKSLKILKEFQFLKSGALQIGQYDNGESGDIRITADGLVARDRNGETTIAIDGETGDAVFKGKLQSGSLITGDIAVGNGDIIIDGAGKRMIWYNTGIAAIVIGNM